MAFSKVILNDETLMDVTTDTVEASNLLTGNTATAASGQKVSGAYVPSNDFIITLTQNQSGDWEPDCTFAEAFAAYNAGKNLAGKAGDYNTIGITYSDDNSAFVVLVEEGFQDDLQNWGVINKGYFWSSSGMELDEDSRYYSTELADAVPANVLSGKKFYNADGYQVGTIVTKTSSDLTASGATVTVPSGYYASQASKSVSTTTHPNPTASVNSTTGLVTASHTQTAGYVSAGTTTGTLQLTTQEAKTVTPTESEQTAVAAGRYTTGAVKVGAIPSDYIGSDITERSYEDLTASGATVTVPAGYYASQASKSVATTTHPSPSINLNSTTGAVTASHTQTTGYVTGGTTTGTLQLPYQSAKTVTPTESEQTAVNAGVYTLGAVKVGAISSTYVGSGIDQNDSDDLTASGATVTVPAGYYAEDASKTIASGSATISTTITPTPSISVDSTTGEITASVNGSVGAKPTVTPGYISEGTNGTITYRGTATSQLTTQAAKTVAPTESEQTAVDKNVYTTGVVKVGAISSTYVGSGITQRDSDDLTVSGATVTAPTGYYSAAASKTIASGSATVTAEKTVTPSTISINYSTGEVSSRVTNSVSSITPTVTPGYISSGTAGSLTITGGSKTSSIALQTKTVLPSGLEQVIVPYDKVLDAETYVGGFNGLVFKTNSSISHSLNLVSGTTYIIATEFSINSSSESGATVYDSLTYDSVVVWDGSWSPQYIPKGAAPNYVKSLTLGSDSVHFTWNDTTSGTVCFRFSFKVYKYNHIDSFISSVTVQPIPKLAELVSLLNDYQIVTADADMGEVYCSLVSFFDAIESGGYNYGASLLESAGSNLLTDDAETLYGDRTIEKVNNGGGFYTIQYQ